MLRYLRRLLRANPATPPAQSSFEEAAERFRGWLEDSAREQVLMDKAALDVADRHLTRAREDMGKTLPEPLAADAASFLGEYLRPTPIGGDWSQDTLYGPVLSGIGGVRHGKLIPLAVIQQKWDKGSQFSLPRFIDSLHQRINAERNLTTPQLATTESIIKHLRGKSGTAAQEAARQQAEAFRDYWKKRHGNTLPLTLLGVREADTFLRTHYLANFLSEEHLVLAGFYLGEVGRGLFGGDWDFQNLNRPDRAPLRYPELDYYPIGRIYKMMTQQPETEPLDEYLRLIPSARAELRKQNPH